MQTINTFKPTKTFCINSLHVQHMTIINDKFGKEIVSVGHNNRDRLAVYTVRIINQDIMADYLIDVISGRVEILDQTISRLNSNRVA